MNFNIKISSEVNENEWNENLSKSSTSTIYQSYNWQKLYREAFSSKPFFITITDDSGNVVGQLACLIHEKMLWGGTNPVSKKIGNYYCNYYYFDSSYFYRLYEYLKLYVGLTYVAFQIYLQYTLYSMSLVKLNIDYKKQLWKILQLSIVQTHNEM